MHELNNILVILDPSQDEQPALTRAAYLAEASGACLHLFLCAYDKAVGIATFLSGRQRDSFIRTVVDGSKVMVERLAAPLAQRGIELTQEVIWDKHPTDRILARCEEGNYDLVVKQAQHYYRADAMFNHMDWDLLCYSPSPVMLVKDGQWDDVGQVLAAIDPSPEDDFHQNLNQRILKLSNSLAQLLNFELHLVSAYPAPPVFAPVSTVVQSQLNYRSKMSAMVEEYLFSLAAQYGITTEHVHAIEGPTDWAIASVSKDLFVEFVVMGNVSRPGMAGLSVGSSAEAALDALETNVLMVRAED